MNRQGDASNAGGAAAGPPRVTPRIAAEAATWVARLHGPSRTREMELQCLEWQAKSAAHRHAFERCTETWMEVPNAARAGGFSTTLTGGGSPEEGDDSAGGRRKRRLLVMATIAIVAIGAGVIGLRSHGGSVDYRTAVGEAQTVVLDDGSRMSLNTNTRVRVEYRATQRTVRVDLGEAAFQVAKDAARPFVVRAGGSEVVALGTVFSVRLTPAGPAQAESLAVTLVRGQVAVRAAADAATGEVAPQQPLVMQPGERVRIVKGADGKAAAQRLDRPRLDQVLAWERSEAEFDMASLADAVAEMNRYSRTPIVLAADLAHIDWQVSGQFRTGDNAAFANALAKLHGLVVKESDGRLVLSRAP